MSIFIILGVMLQALAYNEIAWCDTLKTRTKFSINDNIFQVDSYQQKMKLYTHDDHKHNTLSIYPYTMNKPDVRVRSHYNYKSSLSPIYRSKIQLQNDSIHVFHSFRVQHNIYQENLSFMQLGVHNLLSKQILNFGGGKRHLYHNKHAIGCNTLYHCPISKTSNQPCSINFGVEYWLNNTLFMLSNYYNLDNIFTSKKSLQQYDITNPNSAYQIHVQMKFPYFLAFTGLIKLERLLYDKKYGKIFNTKNNDYYLSLDLNYKPIPILGFNINNIFINKKYCNTACQILIDYQFGVPISKQIQYTNKSNTSLLKYLDTIIIQPFIPTVMQYNECMFLNNCSNKKSLSYTQQIIGYPGEIKIIETDDHNDKSAQWNFNLLQSQGGNVVPITNNTFALYLPNHPLTKEDDILISHTTNTTQNSDQKQKKQNIHILVKNFPQQKLSNVQQNGISTVTTNRDSGINITENTIKSSPMHKENHYNVKDNTPISHVSIKDNTTTENSQNIEEIEDDFVFPAPPPPPIPPVLFSEKQLPTDSNLLASSTPNDTLLPSPSCSMPFNNKHQTYSSSNDEYQTIHDNNFPEYSDIEFNVNDDLSQRLSVHKKSKFSLIGTTEHINKLENVISERKKTKFPNSDMAQIFFKLNLNKSSSSTSEDCDTDDSNDSFNSNN